MVLFQQGSDPTAINSMPAHANVRPELHTAHEAFGKSLGNWLKSQGFSQQIPHTWSLERRESGIEEPAGPHNSSTSQIVRGIALPAGVGVWHAWENFNRAVAENDVRGVQSQRIKDAIKNAEPFLTVDGKVADMIDFISMFAGRQEIPAQYNIDLEAARKERERLQARKALEHAQVEAKYAKLGLN